MIIIKNFFKIIGNFFKFLKAKILHWVAKPYSCTCYVCTMNKQNSTGAKVIKTDITS